MDPEQHRVREARLARGYSQEQLAEKLGWDRRTLSQLECETRDPRMSTLQTIANALECSVTELLPRTELHAQ